MHRLASLLFFLICFGSVSSFSQETDSTEIFLLTVSPAIDPASIYGHSAIRIVKPSLGFDRVYSWGVYDFNTTNFVWKFAKGRLKYRIADDEYARFIQQYDEEQRTVISQKINLGPGEKNTVIRLISLNLQPENMFYLYDFFYDNCATRIRDILEKAVGGKLVYPAENTLVQPSLRELINEAQRPMPWLTLGTDLLIGTPGDTRAGFRERMFLPKSLSGNLSLAGIQYQQGRLPLLQKPVKMLSYPEPETGKNILLSPLFIFSTLFILIMLLSLLVKNQVFNHYLDFFLFFVFSLLAMLMLFCNFFTDHQAMKFNLNIIWLNPFLLIACISLFIKSRPTAWFRIILFTSIVFLLALPFIPQSVNAALIPLILVLILRSAWRSRLGFLNTLSIRRSNEGIR